MDGESDGSRSPRIPITIVTGFAGAGKTSLILNLLPQLRQENPGYKLALVKNEIGDLAIDTALAASAEIAGGKELLGDCICCTNIGQIEDALASLDRECHPDRIIIETSGSAEPLKLVLEIRRISAATGRYELDGVVSVIDAENWGGYANTSYTAKLQAKQTDIIVINKWESLDERAFDLFLDKLGDMDVETPQIKSDKGWISKDLLFGFDSRMASAWMDDNTQIAEHQHGHSGEMECISVTLDSGNHGDKVDLEKLETLLKSAPKDEVFRIKAILRCDLPIEHSSVVDTIDSGCGPCYYILNWSFGRWSWTAASLTQYKGPALRMSIFTAQYESGKWIKRIKSGSYIALVDSKAGSLEVKRVQ